MADQRPVGRTAQIRPGDAAGPSRPAAIYAEFEPAEGQGQSRGELRMGNAAITSDPWDGRPPRETRFVELLKTRNGGIEVRNLSPILDELRAIKSAREIALIRRASQLAAKTSPHLRLTSSVPQAISRGTFSIRGMCLAQWM